MTKLTLLNARIVTPEGIARGSITIEDGVIARLDGPTIGPARDMAGDIILPGLIDLHGDAIEKEVEPRPGAAFPLPVALGAIDRRMAAAGVTTAFHGISFAEGELGVRNISLAETMAQAVRGFGAAAIDHRVHLRYEVTDGSSEDTVAALLSDGTVKLLSFMDHTPGQGQFKDAASYAAHVAWAYETDQKAIERRIVAKRGEAAHVVGRMQRLAAIAIAHGVALAGHDDEGEVRVAFMKELGARISEFPLDLATARAAHSLGLTTLFGAPNVLRGRSQSGALSAREAVVAGLAGALCSDYAPQALLPALGILTDEMGVKWSDAIALFSGNPAGAAGLDDRGRIVEGLRADLLRVSGMGMGLIAKSVWASGREVYRFADRSAGS